jgi:hypothetical protein
VGDVHAGCVQYGALLILVGAFATVSIEDGENRSPGGGAQLEAMQTYLGDRGGGDGGGGGRGSGGDGGGKSTSDAWGRERPPVDARVAFWTLAWAALASVVALAGASTLLWAALWLYWKLVM